jgi:hypothetical protein
MGLYLWPEDEDEDESEFDRGRYGFSGEEHGFWFMVSEALLLCILLSLVLGS